MGTGEGRISEVHPIKNSCTSSPPEEFLREQQLKRTNSSVRRQLSRSVCECQWHNYLIAGRRGDSRLQGSRSCHTQPKRLCSKSRFGQVSWAPSWWPRVQRVAWDPPPRSRGGAENERRRQAVLLSRRLVDVAPEAFGGPAAKGLDNRVGGSHEGGPGRRPALERVAGRPKQVRRRRRTVRNRVREKGVKPSPSPKRGAEAGRPVQRTWRAA